MHRHRRWHTYSQAHAYNVNLYNEYILRKCVPHWPLPTSRQNLTTLDIMLVLLLLALLLLVPNVGEWGTAAAACITRRDDACNQPTRNHHTNHRVLPLPRRCWWWWTRIPKTPTTPPTPLWISWAHEWVVAWVVVCVGHARTRRLNQFPIIIINAAWPRCRLVQEQ